MITSNQKLLCVKINTFIEMKSNELFISTKCTCVFTVFWRPAVMAAFWLFAFLFRRSSFVKEKWLSNIHGYRQNLNRLWLKVFSTVILSFKTCRSISRQYEGKICCDLSTCVIYDVIHSFYTANHWSDSVDLQQARSCRTINSREISTQLIDRRIYQNRAENFWFLGDHWNKFWTWLLRYTWRMEVAIRGNYLEQMSQFLVKLVSS